MKVYEIEYSFLSYFDESYDFARIQVEAISPSQALQKAKQKAPMGAKKFEIIK